MMELGKFDNEVLKTMRGEMQFQLDKIANSYGISLKLKNIIYYDYTFSSKVEGKILKNSAEIEKKEFAKLAHKYGLKPEDYNTTFRSGAKTFTIYAIKTRNRKYPILAKGSDGKGYKFDVMTILANTGRLKKMMSVVDAGVKMETL